MKGARDVVVYTQPHCAGCREVESFLERRGVTFVVRDVSADPRALEELAAHGYMTTPVVRVGDRWVHGARRRDLERLLGAR
ncbi:MAG: glutaredoxin family protein [Candidatus Limnocylindria bacterium]